MPRNAPRLLSPPVSEVDMMFLHDIMGIMKKMETVLTERGQTSIPAQLRKHMHLMPGAKLRWQELSEHECRLIVQQSTPGPGARTMLGYAKRFRKARTTREWMRELREGELP